MSARVRRSRGNRSQVQVFCQGKKKSYFLGVSCVMTTQTQRNGKKSLIGEGGAIFFLNMPTEIGMRLVCRQMRQTEFSRRSSVKAYKNNMKNDL